METLVSLGCTPDGENILRKKSAEGVLLERIEQPKEGLFNLNLERVEQLARSVRNDGLVYPVLLLEIPGPFPTMHEVLDGQHRVEAVRRLHSEACASMNPDHIGMWNRVPAIIVTGLETEDAKNLYRIKANLERNVYPPEEHARLVAEQVRLEGIVRKGKNVQLKENPQQDKTLKLKVFKGRGNQGCASQLAKDFGYSDNTMRSRFKQWAEANKYQGPMSSVQGDDIKSLAKFCADFESEKAAKKGVKAGEVQDKAAKQREKNISEQKANVRNGLLYLQSQGVELPGMDLVLEALGVGGAA